MCGEWQGDGSGMYDHDVSKEYAEKCAEDNWGCIVGAAKLIVGAVILAALIGMLR